MGDMDLHTPAELLIYALIDGICKSSGNPFVGSVAHISKRVKVTRQGVYKILDSFIRRGLLVKDGNGLRTCKPSLQKKAPELVNPVEKNVNSVDTLVNSVDKNVNSVDTKKKVNKSIKENESRAGVSKPTLAEVEEYARQLHAVNPHAFADFFIKFCEANEWRTRNGQGNPITNWRSYIVTSWGHRLNDPFKNYSPTPQRPAPSYRQMTDAEFQNFLKS